MTISDADLRAEHKRFADHIIATTTINALRAAGGSVEILLPHLLARASLYTPMKGSPEVEFADGGDILSVDRMIDRMRADPNFGRCFKSGKAQSAEQPIPAKNPFAKGPFFNLTEAMRIEKADPELARRMKHAAGVR